MLHLKMERTFSTNMMLANDPAPVPESYVNKCQSPRNKVLTI